MQAALTAGKVNEAQIDDKVRRLLRKLTAWRRLSPCTGGTSRRSARTPGADPAGGAESIVLLKNEGGILPLHPDKPQTITVIGANANGRLSWVEAAPRWPPITWSRRWKGYETGRG